MGEQNQQHRPTQATTDANGATHSAETGQYVEQVGTRPTGSLYSGSQREDAGLPPQTEPVHHKIGKRAHEWRLNGKLHREDGPALIESSGVETWYFNGLEHRVDGPAWISRTDAAIWFYEGEFHRNGGPAIVDNDGSRQWYVHGVRNRLDGPAVITAEGDQEWWVGGVRHRTDGPAMMMADGRQAWYHGNVLHRTDGGPAMTGPHGQQAYYIAGILHRDREQGPAVTRLERNTYNEGAHWVQEFWEHGALVGTVENGHFKAFKPSPTRTPVNPATGYTWWENPIRFQDPRIGPPVITPSLSQRERNLLH